MALFIILCKWRQDSVVSSFIAVFCIGYHSFPNPFGYIENDIGLGALGIVGPVDYSMSPGIIAATGCASRFPLIPAGIGLVVCAFFPGFIECLNAIPGVVMGAVLLYLMASQLSAGMQMMIREKAVDGFDGGIVVGFSLMVALLLSFAPDEALNSIPALIRPIVGNGFVMGVITVLILEHLIFRAGKKAKKE